MSCAAKKQRYPDVNHAGLWATSGVGADKSLVKDKQTSNG